MQSLKYILAIGALAIASAGFAQTYPVKPVRVLVAFAPGGGIDIIALSVAPLLQERTGMNLVHVPYKGMAPVIQDLVAGRIQAMVYPATSQMTGYMKEGKLRALAAAAPQRLAALPDVPTFDEAGIADFNAAGWIALFAPAGTPREILERLNRESVRAVGSPEMAQVYAKLSMLPGPMSSDEFARFYNREFDYWGNVT